MEEQEEIFSRVRDLCALSDLSDSSILACLEARARRDCPYTSAGHVLVSVRPWLLLSSQPDPHPTQLAERAVRRLLASQEDQSIVLLGLRGSGKTHLARELLRSIVGTLPAAQGIREKITTAGVLINSFSQTRDHLSRCITTATVLVDPQLGEVGGCHFSGLLLDCRQVEGFRVFSWLQAGLPPAQQAAPGLEEHTGGSPPLRGEPRLLNDTLEALGMEETLRHSFLHTLVAILHLARGEPSRCSGLLGVQWDELQGALGSPADCQRVASFLYAHLFRWIVRWVNAGLQPLARSQCCALAVVDPVGGVQDGQPAPPEALLTSYITEGLLNVYCQRVFEWEQDQYLQEGVEWEAVEVGCNHSLLQTLQESGGVLEALCARTWEGVVEGLAACSAHSRDVCSLPEGEVVVMHSAGEQTYRIDREWCQRNSPSSPTTLWRLLATSSSPVVEQLAQSLTQRSPDVLLGLSLGPLSLTQRAEQGVGQLLEWVMTSHPHFLLCIRPSETPDTQFSREAVLRQLQALKVLDTALMQSCGFPVHIPHSEFVARYCPALLRGVGRGAEPAEACRMVLERAGLKEWHIGKTQVLLKVWHLERLEAEMELFQASASKLQKAFRRHLSLRDGQKRVQEEMERSYMPEEGAESDEAGMGGAGMESEEAGVGGVCQLEPDQDHQVCPVQQEAGPEEGVNGICRMEPETDRQVCSVNPGEGDEVFELDIPPTPPPRPLHTFDLKQVRELGKLTFQPDPRLAPGRRNPRPVSAMQTAAWPQARVRGATGGKRPSWGKTKSTPSKHRRPSPSEEELQRQVWFHGKISRELAELQLRTAPYDCFLLRESENRAGGFSLSLSHRGAIRHFRVERNENCGRFEVLGAKWSFPSLATLVDYYSQHCVTTDGEVLRTPCPLMGSSSTPPPLPPRRRNLSTIRRPTDILPPLPPSHPPPRSLNKYNITQVPGIAPGPPGLALSSARSQSLGIIPDLSQETVAMLQRELQVEERIVEAARRLANMPAPNKKDRQKRKQSLQQAQSRLLSLRQQYHTLQERLKFIEISMKNMPEEGRRTSAPLPPGPPLRH